MSDQVRIYLRDLRIRQGLSQERAADNIGWSSRSFNDWETGKSGDIKSRYLIRLVVLLKASWEEIVNLEMKDMSSHDAETEQQPSRPSLDLFNDEDLERLINQLRVDSDLRTAFLVFWAGWTARRQQPRQITKRNSHALKCVAVSFCAQLSA